MKINLELLRDGIHASVESLIADSKEILDAAIQEELIALGQVAIDYGIKAAEGDPEAEEVLNILRARVAVIMATLVGRGETALANFIRGAIYALADFAVHVIKAAK
jgi:hypothetical protein